MMLWVNIILLLLAIPVGYLIAWLCKDELVKFRKYFRILIIVSIILGIGFWIYGFRVESLTLWFVFIVTLIISYSDLLLDSISLKNLFNFESKSK